MSIPAARSLPRRLAIAASFALLPPVAVASWGCEAGGSSGTGGPVVRDSAGVRITTHPAPGSWEAPVSLTEELRVGGMDGPPERLFSSIAGGWIGSSGDVVLVDRQAREVRRFHADGSVLGSHGREGEGPGEYQWIRAVDACRPDGFTVFDIDWTMSHYDDEGSFVTERPFRLEDGRTPYGLACDRSGRTAVIASDSTWLRQGLFAAMTRLRVLDVEGRQVADLGERLGVERWGQPTQIGPHPAGRALRFGFMGEELVATDGSFFGFERWGPAGELLGIVRIDVPPPDVDSLADAYMEASLARAPDASVRNRWRTSIEAMEWPDTAAFFSDLLVTDDRVLVQEISFGGVGRWFLFEGDGTPRGYLPLPPGARLLHARDDRLLVQETGDFDVPQAVLYSMAWE